ncbi:MAG: thiamine pyrophosphate-binding protein [Victivallales bacterium]|jgi:acetolactate synthase-1/2/3 large subunit|nr:thiamine pyrophosphate-binding protein [Victivallales bacterium]
MIKLSDYVMNFLADHGVAQVFMLPGGGAMHLDDSLGRHKTLKYTCFLHEQALAIAVESYGQHTNRPGVGLVTSGPGSTNTITAVAAGFIDSTAMFMISGQAKRSDLKGDTGVRQMGSQEVDIVSMVKPITKYAVTVMNPEDIRCHLERAWHEATTGRMGPVWLDIPLDVQGSLIDENKLSCFTPPKENIPVLPTKQIADLLTIAKRPLLLIGNGAKSANAAERLVAWAQSNHIPMLCSWKTIDLLPSDHPLCFGCPGIMGSRPANFIVQNADLLLVVGSRLDPSLTAFNSADFGRNAKKIMVDIDAAEIKKIKGIDLSVISDAKYFVDALESLNLKLDEHAEWISYCRNLKQKYPVVLPEYAREANGVNLYAFTDELFRQLQIGEIIVPESSGAAGEITYQAMSVKAGQKIKNAAGLGSMGFGLPYAIGACLAHGGRRTVLINGDGAFQMNIQELETVRRLKLPIKMFIWDNGGYVSIMNTQRNMFDGFFVGSDPGSGLTLPNVTRQAKVYDIRTVEINSNTELTLKISEVLSGDDPVMCRVKIAPNQAISPKVQAQKLPDGGMISKPLEDMWPYLPAEEVAINMIAEQKGRCEK